MEVPTTTGTPIVDPEPTEAEPGPPLALPIVGRAYDPLAPGPVLSQAQGFVAVLEDAGRAACPPATHVLLDRPPGEISPRAVAVVYRASADPNTNLDFHIGRRITASGIESVAPETCFPVTRRMLAVRHVEAVEVPPGAHGRPGTEAATKRTSH